MKKQYINPTMEVVNLKMESNLMTTSSLTVGSSVSSAAGAESRESDDWDE